MMKRGRKQARVLKARQDAYARAVKSGLRMDGRHLPGALPGVLVGDEHSKPGGYKRGEDVSDG